MNSAYIALGGNLGEVKASFDSACELLQKSCSIVAKSKLYQTPAIGPLLEGKQQPDYLNAVIQVSTNLAAADLLALLHEVEAQHGRVRKEHWGARTLDLDLLAYEGVVCSNSSLTLPHPRLHERLFVLQPLADIQPDWIHPVSGLNIKSMLQALNNGKVRLFEGRVWTDT